MLAKKRILILAGKNILLYCSALAELLSQNAALGVDVVEEENFGASTCRPGSAPGLVIYFADQPVTTPVSRIATICGKQAKLLLVLGSGDKLSVRLLANLDVDGVIFSGVAFTELLTAINTLLFKNLKYISPSLIANFSGPLAHDPFSTLSKKEMDIALIVAKGKRNFQIAADLNISPKTVNTYKARIYKKLGIDNDMQLLKLTMQADVPAAIG